MSENTLRGAIEAILMVASEPVAASDLADVLGVSTADIEQHLRALAAEYLGEGRNARAVSSCAKWRAAGASIPHGHTRMWSVVSSSAPRTRAFLRLLSKRWRSLPTVSPFRGRESAVFVG